MNAGDVLLVAVPFTWWGLVMGISGLEAPLKFRAPGITVALGLGIGRLVFRALNLAELLCAVLLAVALFTTSAYLNEMPTIVAVVVLFVLFVVQLAALRPALDRRTKRVLAGEELPRSRVHLVYIALEAVKLVLLPVLGVVFILALD
ncbi:MAG TPA: hypothetical protein VFE65_26700 [Pseudonocardia sp.]|jgi:hypothetical protein|nr:hypothetical protein [Pseudonocardia sp.]